MPKLIHNFAFNNSERRNIELSDSNKILLIPNKNVIQLKRNAGGEFPIDPDIWVRTPLFNPNAVQTWLNFDAKITAPDGTEIKYRLNDGQSDFFWDGTGWIVGTGWNSLDDVNQHISNFHANQKQIQVVANLLTRDTSVTPSLFEIRILYELVADFNFREDVISNSLIPLLESIGPNIAVGLAISEGYVIDVNPPAIVLKNIDFTNKIKGNISEFIIKDQSIALEIPPPTIVDIEFDISAITENGFQDNHELSEKINTLFEHNRFLTSVGLNQRYPLQLTEELSIILQDREDKTDRIESEGRARIQGVQFYLKESSERKIAKGAKLILKKQAVGN